MTFSLSSKVSIASTDGLLGLALIACKPELFSSGLTTSRSSNVPAKPLGTNAATRLKICSRARTRCTVDAGDPEPGGLEHALLLKKLPRPGHKGDGLFQTARLLEKELLQPRWRGVIEGVGLR